MNGHKNTYTHKYLHANLRTCTKYLRVYTHERKLARDGDNFRKFRGTMFFANCYNQYFHFLITVRDDHSCNRRIVSEKGTTSEFLVSYTANFLRVISDLCPNKSAH